MNAQLYRLLVVIIARQGPENEVPAKRLPKGPGDHACDLQNPRLTAEQEIGLLGLETAKA